MHYMALDPLDQSITVDVLNKMKQADDTTLPFIYTFKHRLGLKIMCGSMFFLFLALAVITYNQGGGIGLAIFCIGSALLFFIGIPLDLYMKANILIDDKSICKLIFGRQFQCIKWDSVERIDVRSGYVAGENLKIHAYGFVSAKNISRFSRKRKFIFTDYRNDVSSLLRHINVYIAKFNITVVHIENGVKTTKTSL